MMRWIVGSSLKFRILVVAMATGMMALGFVQLQKLPVDVFPEFAPPRVEIQTACLGLAAAEVESLVTVPMEVALNGVPGLDTLRSKSLAQLSSIELLFKPGTDLFKARQLVAERLATVTPSLPTWAAPPVMLQPVSSMGRVMKIGLTSDSRSLIDMSMISYWTIRAKLLQVPGVANVAIWGERLQMLQVQVDPAKLKAHDITLDEVMTVTADSLDVGLLQFSEGAVIGTGGYVTTPNQAMGIRHVLSIKSPADLAQIPITERDGKPLLLGDVADVKEDHQPLIGDAVIHGGPGLLLVVEKLPWANTLDVTAGVQRALDELKPGLSGISIDPQIFRPASFIETAIDNLSRALLLGCLFVVLVLGLFLFEWRTALISLIAIPLSLLAAGLVLYYSRATVNTMVLAGLVIAVGVVVDDAIIDIENIVRRLREHRRSGDTRSTAAVVLSASIEVRGPIVYATLIVVAAAAPVLFLGGLTGAFFRPLAMSYTLAVLASLVVALTVTPALALLLLAKGTLLRRRESPVVRVLQGGYTAFLTRAVRKPFAAFATVAFVVVAGLAVLPGFGQSLLPAFKERNVFLHFISVPGTAHDEEVRLVETVSAELRNIPGIQTYGAHIGQAFLGDETAGVNFGELWISIDPKVDYDKTITRIQAVANKYPGIRHNVYTYLRERTDEVLTGSGDAIVVRIYGQDLDVLREKAAEIQDLMSDTDGIVDEHTDLEVDVPQVEVQVDLAKAEAYGIKPGDVRRAAATIFAGEEVGDIFRDGKAYDVVVWSTPASRSSVTSIEQLPIDTPSGQVIHLSDVATVVVRQTPNVIQHADNSRYIDVSANAEGRDLGTVVTELQAKIDKVSFPQQYHAEVLGEYAERQSAQRQILLFGAAAALLILLLLRLSFDSWRLAILSFVTLPSALVGGVLAAFAGGRIISLGSLVGFLTVLGIAARNGILLISHYQHLEKHEGETFGRALVVRGSRDRLSPILMTTLATALALVPLVVLGDVPGHEIEHPTAVVIVGGLVTSTLLNLFIVPVLYLHFGRRRRDRADQPTVPQQAISPEAAEA